MASKSTGRENYAPVFWTFFGMRLICALLILKLNLRCANILKLSNISLIFPVSSSLLRKCSRTSGSWSWSPTSSCSSLSSSSAAPCGASLNPTFSGSLRTLAQPSWPWASPWRLAPLLECPSPSAAPSSLADLGIKQNVLYVIVAVLTRRTMFLQSPWPHMNVNIWLNHLPESNCSGTTMWLCSPSLFTAFAFLATPSSTRPWSPFSLRWGSNWMWISIWKLWRSGFNSSSLYLLAQKFWSLGFEAFWELSTDDCR